MFTFKFHLNIEQCFFSLAGHLKGFFTYFSTDAA